MSQLVLELVPLDAPETLAKYIDEVAAALRRVPLAQPNTTALREHMRGALHDVISCAEEVRRAT